MEVKEHLKEYNLTSKESDFETSQITSSRDSVETLRKLFGDSVEVYESFYALFLNRANKTIGWLKVSQGGVAGTVVDPKMIFFAAIKSLASGIIVAHNHPSGNLQASKADKDMTKRLKDIGKSLDIQVMDHIILTKDHYYSFCDEGQL